MCMCVYVCMYVCVHVCMCMCECVHVCVCVRVYVLVWLSLVQYCPGAYEHMPCASDSDPACRVLPHIHNSCVYLL